MLLNYVNDLLDMDQIKKGVYTKILKNFDPNEVIMVTSEMFKDQCKSKRIKLVIQSKGVRKSNLNLIETVTTYPSESNDSNGLPYLRGDMRRFQQVLINLIKNSLKFSNKRGSITIQSSYNLDKKKLKVAIIDNGKGIEPEKLTELFKRFGKLNNDSNFEGTGTLNPEGVGLGLMICQNLVK